MKTLVALTLVLGASAAFAGPQEIALRPVEQRIAEARAQRDGSAYALTGRSSANADQQPVQHRTHNNPVFNGGRGAR